MLEWGFYYLQCGWLWSLWGLLVAQAYTVAYLGAYGGPAVCMAATVVDFWLFLNMGIGTRILRKAAAE